MTLCDQVNTNIIGNKLTEWLMKTYECINVPYGAMPPSPDQYDLPEGKARFLARNQISLCSEEFKLDADYKQQVSEKINEYFERFKFKIMDELEKDGINEGDELYVLDYPIVLVDEPLLRQRRFGIYGWLEVFSKKVELEDEYTRTKNR